MIAETTESVEIPQTAIDALRGALLGTVIVPGPMGKSLTTEGSTR